MKKVFAAMLINTALVSLLVNADFNVAGLEEVFDG